MKKVKVEKKMAKYLKLPQTQEHQKQKKREGVGMVGNWPR